MILALCLPFLADGHRLLCHLDSLFMRQLAVMMTASDLSNVRRVLADFRRNPFLFSVRHRVLLLSRIE
jgi:hypothetical protein